MTILVFEAFGYIIETKGGLIKRLSGTEQEGCSPKKDGRHGQPEGIRERQADNHLFDILKSGDRGKNEEKKMNRQGIRHLKEKTASLKMVPILNGKRGM